MDLLQGLVPRFVVCERWKVLKSFPAGESTVDPQLGMEGDINCQVLSAGQQLKEFRTSKNMPLIKESSSLWPKVVFSCMDKPMGQ